MCTFGAGVLMCRGDRRGDTLGGGSFSLSSLIFVAVLKMSASWRRAAVCCSVRSIGASLFLFINALMRSCAASRMVSPGSMFGSLQCAG